MEMNFRGFKLEVLDTEGTSDSEGGMDDRNSVRTVIIKVNQGMEEEEENEPPCTVDLEILGLSDKGREAASKFEETAGEFPLLANMLLEEKGKVEPEIVEAPEEVVSTTSKYPLLEKLLDSKEKMPVVGCEFKMFDEALKEFNEASYAAATNMLLNYDSSKYMAVPVDDEKSKQRNSSLLPISIIGYNYIDINRASVKPTEVLPRYQPKKPKDTIVLTCNETMPAETSEDSSSAQLKGPYNCTVCFEKFFTKEYLHCHMIRSHNIKLASNEGKYMGYVSQVDGTSLVSFQKVEEVSLHPERFRCHSCSKSYTYIRNLKKHEKAVHNGISNTSYRTRVVNSLKHPGKSDNVNQCIRVLTHQCRICQQEFLDKRTLALHSKLHVSTCQVCHKVFGTKRGLKLHGAIHFGNQGKQFGCQFCDKRYSHARSLKHHLKQHCVSESTMEAQPQAQPEDSNGKGGSVAISPGVANMNDMEIVSYTFGAVEETL